MSGMTEVWVIVEVLDVVVARRVVMDAVIVALAVAVVTLHDVFRTVLVVSLAGSGRLSSRQRHASMISSMA